MKKSILFVALLGSFFAGAARPDEGASKGYKALKHEMEKHIYTRFLGPYAVRDGTGHHSDIRLNEINPIFPDEFCRTLDRSRLNNEQKTFFCKKWIAMHEDCLELTLRDVTNPNNPCKKRSVALLAVMADLEHANKCLLSQNHDWNKVFDDLKKKYDEKLAEDSIKGQEKLSDTMIRYFASK